MTKPSIPTSKRFIALAALMLVVAVTIAACAFSLVAVQLQVSTISKKPKGVDQWYTYRPTSGAYVISFPGVAETRVDRSPPGQKLLYTAKVEEKGQLFKVTRESLHLDEPEVRQVLRATMNTLLKRYRASEVSCHERQSSHSHTLECEAKGWVGGKRVEIRCRFHYANESVFCLLWVGSPFSEPDTDIYKFFNLFRPLNVPNSDARLCPKRFNNKK